MQKKILMVENRKNYIRIIKQVTEKLLENVELLHAKDTNEGIIMAMENEVNVFIVDLDIGACSDVVGLKFIENLRQYDKYRFTPIIVLSSAKDPNNHVYENLHCYSFMEKPIKESVLMKKISEALLYSQSKRVIKQGYFKIDGIYHAIDVEDIIYTESHNRMMQINTTKKQYIVPYVTCEQFLERYNSDIFIRCSKSAIVSKNYIQSVDFTNRYIELTQDFGYVGIGIYYRKQVENNLLLIK